MYKLILPLILAWTLQPVIGGQVGPTGDDKVPGTNTEAQASIPMSERKRNTGGSNGAGLCVFTSIEHAARRQNVFQLKEFQKFMKVRPGGGYPSKVDAKIEELCKEKGYPKPQYLQINSTDLEILRAACKSGRMPSVTYSYSPTGRYNGRRIAHMVNLVHADEKWWGILDNNYITQIEWLSEEEFRGPYMGRGKGWSVILLKPGPPPHPFN